MKLANIEFKVEHRGSEACFCSRNTEEDLNIIFTVLLETIFSYIVLLWKEILVRTDLIKVILDKWILEAILETSQSVILGQQDQAPI